MPRSRPKRDLSGNRYGRLTVENPHHSNSDCWFYVCRCTCGRRTMVRSLNLVSGNTKSCGCLQKTNAIKHGFSRTSEYTIWSLMKSRCFAKENNKNFSRYSGRGIGICRRWMKFANFLADMGPRPSPKHSIDRIDNNGDYTPRNCRWATNQQQCRNKRNNRMITIDGKTLCLQEWSELTGISRGTIWDRLMSGWSHRDAVLTKPRTRLRKSK